MFMVFKFCYAVVVEAKVVSNLVPNGVFNLFYKFIFGVCKKFVS